MVKEKNDLIRVYTGTELTVNLLRSELEGIGIASVSRNDFVSGISAGFAGGIPDAIDLYIKEADLERAWPVIIEFEKINPV